jgi:signal transduction histidine kinase
MKLAAWGCCLTKPRAEGFLFLGFWVIGGPAILFLLYLLLWPAETNTPHPFQHAEKWVETLAGIPFDHTGFAQLERQPPNLEAAKWQAVELPDVIQLPAISEVGEMPSMVRAWYRLRYESQAGGKADEPLALYGTRIMGGAYTVWMNGRLLESSLDDWRMQWNKPLMVKLPTHELEPGQVIDIYLGVPYREAQGFAVGSLYLGPVSSIRPLFDTRVFLQESLPRASLLVSLLLGLMSFHVWLARRSESPHLLMALTSVAWFICNLQYFLDFSSDEAIAAWYGALVDIAVSWMVPLIYMFALRFDQRLFPRVEKLLLGYALAMTVFTLPIWNWGVTALLLHHDLDLVIAVGVSVFVTWLAIKGGGLEFRLICLAIWSLPALGAHDLLYMTSQRAPDGIHLFPYATFIVFGSFLFSIQRRYINAMDSIESVNASLDQRLREREAELEIKHQELNNIGRQQALLNERQRLMRDMHDGIGSRLMSSLAVIDRGGLDAKRVALVLRECMDDLKLVIDSLEPIAHDLVTLLATLRFRLGGRLELAGIRIVWDVQDIPLLPWLEPPEALEILHILQEALTNVLKHAEATQVRISTRTATTDGGMPCVVVVVADNGSGFLPSGASGGRGLRNMQERAARLEGRFKIEPKEMQGTVVTLELPVEKHGV